jgi:hypothetical protein
VHGRGTGWLIADFMTGSDAPIDAYWHFDPAWLVEETRTGALLAHRSDGDTGTGCYAAIACLLSLTAAKTAVGAHHDTDTLVPTLQRTFIARTYRWTADHLDRPG